MRRLITVLVFVMAAGLACSDNDILFLSNFTAQPPDTTYDQQVQLAGEAIRVPPLQAAILVVTVRGGVATVSDTANLHGLFSLTIPLVTNTVNHLEATAHDNLGAVMPTPMTWDVVQIDTTTPLANTSGAR
jgi:hypothetical protein